MKIFVKKKRLTKSQNNIKGKRKIVKKKLKIDKDQKDLKLNEKRNIERNKYKYKI